MITQTLIHLDVTTRGPATQTQDMCHMFCVRNSILGVPVHCRTSFRIQIVLHTAWAGLMQMSLV